MCSFFLHKYRNYQNDFVKDIHLRCKMYSLFSLLCRSLLGMGKITEFEATSTFEKSCFHQMLQLSIPNGSGAILSKSGNLKSAKIATIAL